MCLDWRVDIKDLRHSCPRSYNVSPVYSSPEENYPYFDRIHQLFVDIGEKKYDNSNMDYLSMGMSHGFASAIAFGSNPVRIATGSFDARHYGSMP